MYRIKDPAKSLPFYQDVMGMDLVDTHKASDFTYVADESVRADLTACTSWAVRRSRPLRADRPDKHQGDIPRGDREALLELTHNHGSEDDASFGGYKSGNEVRGVVADDADTMRTTTRALGTSASASTTSRAHAVGFRATNQADGSERFERLGVKFQKKLTDGKMVRDGLRLVSANRSQKNIAFALDPDGYWCAPLLFSRNRRSAGSRSSARRPRRSLRNDPSMRGVYTVTIAP